MGREGVRVRDARPHLFPSPGTVNPTTSDARWGSIRCVARTTIDIDASVLRELKRRQRREQKTLGVLVSELLARALAEPEGHVPPPPLVWTTRDLRPRVDIDDKDALWAALDER